MRGFFSLHIAGVAILLSLGFSPPAEGICRAINSICNVGFDPQSPAALANGDRVNLSFEYRSDQPVLIFARPFTGDSLSPNYAAHPSPLHPAGFGQGSGFFTIQTGDVKVDRVRLQMLTADQKKVLAEIFIPVEYAFGDRRVQNSISRIRLSPASPAALGFGDDVSVTFDYVAGEPVRIFARPLTGNSLSPNYAAHGSPLYPAGNGSGSGSFTITSGNVTVDGVRLQMVNADQSRVLVEEVVRVDYRFGPPPPDLVAGRLEVTQAVQDLNNSVRLVRNKRTFVRFHVSSSMGNHSSYATLVATRNGTSTTLLPLNGSIVVRSSPDRDELDHAFLFELPSFYRRGTVSLTATLNPVLPWRSRDPLEATYANNSTTTTVSYETVPKVNLVMYRVGYRMGGTTYYPPSWQRDQMVDWLKRAFPINDLDVWNRTHYMGNGLPSCGQVNAVLVMKRLLNNLASFFGGSTIPRNAHYYGMVDDRGDFMRGCALGIPSSVASGPTGTGTWGWDTDGSYGDWYGGHELAHTFGRFHAEFCGAGGGTSYPYTSGRISPSLTGNNALYGFDIGTRDIYGPEWKDVMTYCDNQWVSDFTYEGIMSFLQSDFARGMGAGVPADGQRLVIVGTIDPVTNNVQLQPITLTPNAGELEPREPGKFAIVLRDVRGRELARYPFTPEEADEGRPIGEPEEREVHLLFISEYVPFVEGTASVDIEGPGGQLLRTVRAGLRPPVVKIISPNGGETLDGPTIPVSWEASDPDGDALTFTIQYTPDDSSWETLVIGLTENSIEFDAADVPGGRQARFRVVAVDGIRSATDESDRTFVVTNRAPVVAIREPVGQITVSFGETVNFEGAAYDIDTGTLADDQLEWISSLQQSLGNGASLAVSDLVVGDHVITFRGDDGEGGVATDTVRVRVVEDPTQVPPETDALIASPTLIRLDTAAGDTNERVRIGNANPRRSIRWKASASERWVGLGAVEGTTPAGLLVSFEDPGLAPGVHRATVQLTSPDVRGQTLTIRVEVVVARTFVGDAFRRGDANADAGVDISDASFMLACLFLGRECPRCPDAADANDDGAVNVSDPSYLLNFLFLGGPPPPPPSRQCGVDPTEDDLGECEYEHCR